MNHTPAFRYPHPLGHTIPSDHADPAGFVGPSYYPVLQEHPTPERIAVNFMHYAEVVVTQQDGIWVHGLGWQTGTSGLCFSPGRKWGEFPDALTATLYAWERIAHDIDHRHRPEDGHRSRLTIALLDQVRSKVAAILLHCAVCPPASWGTSAQLALFP
jgi:hypothetical protein